MKKARILLALLCCAALLMGMTAFAAEAETPEKNGEVMILFTSDVHCGVDQGFGYAGLSQIRDTLEAQGYTTILVDDGDSIQGEAIGTLSKGEAIVELMNDVGYDVAIPGNHEFDYGMDRFLDRGDGYTMFDGAPLLQDSVKIDNQVLIDYIVDTLGGVIGDEYADPYGQGRITIIDGSE